MRSSGPNMRPTMVRKKLRCVDVGRKCTCADHSSSIECAEDECVLGESEGGKETSIRLGYRMRRRLLPHCIANPGREIHLRRDFAYCSDVDPSFRVVWLYEYEVRFAPRCHLQVVSGVVLKRLFHVLAADTLLHPSTQQLCRLNHWAYFASEVSEAFGFGLRDPMITIVFSLAWLRSVWSTWKGTSLSGKHILGMEDCEGITALSNSSLNIESRDDTFPFRFII